MKLTSEIIEWCKAEHYAYFYSDVWLLYTALVFLTIGIATRELKLNMEGNIVTVLTVGFLYGAFVLISAFLYYNIF